MKFKTIEEFLKETKTKIQIINLGKEPTLYFGDLDNESHNTYKIIISNDKGSLAYKYMDTMKHTNNETRPTQEFVIIDLALDLDLFKDGMNIGTFRDVFNFPTVRGRYLDKAYRGYLYAKRQIGYMYSKEVWDRVTKIAKTV